MSNESFEKVKSQIGYCGLWCGSCPGGNGSIIELTSLYEEEVKRNQLELWAPKDFDFKEFMKGLSSIKKMGQCPGCRKEGGNPGCNIRVCTREKGLDDCSSCSVLKTCKNFDELESKLPRIRSDLGKLREVPNNIMIDHQKKELKSKWPHCVMFCKSTK